MKYVLLILVSVFLITCIVHIEYKSGQKPEAENAIEDDDTKRIVPDSCDCDLPWTPFIDSCCKRLSTQVNRNSTE